MKIHLKNGKTITVSEKTANDIEKSMHTRRINNWLKIQDKKTKAIILAIDLMEVIAIEK